MQVLIPFFDKYNLLTSKQLNFLDFKKVANIIQEGRHLTEEGIIEIKSIKANINFGRAFAQKLAFIESIKDSIYITPHWLSGFIDAEAYLGIHLSDGSRRRCEPRFSISQNSHDIVILEAIANFFDTKNQIVNNTPGNDSTKQLSLYDIDTLVNKVIPLLDECQLLTAKRNDFILWKTVLGIMCNKEHLTQSGFERITSLVLKKKI